MSIKQKIVLVSVIPALVAVLLGTNILLSGLRDRAMALQTEDTVRFVAAASDLVRELQRERGMTAIFLARSDSDSSKLAEQRRVSDERSPVFRDSSARTHIDNKVVKDAFY